MQYQCRRFHVKILINCLFHACTIACNLVKYLDPRYIECITSKKGKVSGLNYPRNVAISSCNGTHIPVRAAAACDVNADAINSDSQPIEGLVRRRARLSLSLSQTDCKRVSVFIAFSINKNSTSRSVSFVSIQISYLHVCTHGRHTVAA